MSRPSDTLPTIFVYTEEQRGNQLVESELLGLLSDFSGIEKMVVVRDPYSGIQFVYRVHHESGNLDAACITRFEAADFVERRKTTIDGATYKLGPPQDALKLLRARREWIQDKGSVLAVLLEGAATGPMRFIAPSKRIERPRLREVPHGVRVERLPSSAGTP